MCSSDLVLYNEKGRHDGLTALQVQRKVRGDGTRKGEGLGVK